MKDYHHFQLSPFVSVGERKNSIEHFSIIVKWMKYYTEFCKVTDWRGFMVEKKIFIPVDHIFYANWKNKLMKKNVLCNFKAKKKNI